MNTNRKRNGFSLLELLAVVTILGIIAAIIVPRVTVSTDTANSNVRSHQLATLNAAIERFYIDNNAWPTALTDLVTSYVPDGIPTPPGGGTYGLNTTTNRATYTP